MRKPQRLPKPPWLKVRLPQGKGWQTLAGLTQSLALPTVCEEAKCPNLGECWGGGTATFMLLGEVCTRACRFCSVQTQGRPPLPDPTEPARLAESLTSLNLNYLVLTSVDRDDLPDQGAAHLLACVAAAQAQDPTLKIELLMPDFRGDPKIVEKMTGLGVAVLGHNIECVRSKSVTVRDPRCGYEQSLEVLKKIKSVNRDQKTKSGFMLGFGEEKEEILETFADLREAGVDFLTLGQYLQPQKTKLPVSRYWSPEEFEELKLEAMSFGFSYVAAGPLVRSSYKAFEQWMLGQAHERTI